MHMADALLAPAVAATMYAASAVMVGASVKTLRKDEATAKLPTMAVTSALVFAGQMINYTIPGTGSSGHLCGGMLLSAMLGPWAGWLVSISLGLFAFTSVLGCAVQAETVISFLPGRAAVRPCRVLYGLAVFFGAVLPMETVLQLADLSNALMALPNLMCLILLSGEIAADCRKFRSEKR